ncbi:MAG: hypothetical protein HY060_12075 [Proteobacteria bacterium]|nr:hypothetical protein [Pseudomonadota bacterium]
MLPSLIDLERYPIAALASPGGDLLIADCRAQLARTGACMLPGFLKPDAIAAAADEGARLAPRAHRLAGSRSTCYLAPPDESLPEGHPKRRLQTTSVGAVAYDLIPPDSPIRALYESETVLDFIGAALGVERLYRYADLLGALNIAVMTADEHLLWHFDQTDFVVSILLQECVAGGAFEFVPRIRSADDPHYAAIERLLDGGRDGVIRLDMQPGTLALFQGRWSIHRVTPIEGARPRLIALLGYDTKPGTVSSDNLKLRRYGRLG